MLNDDSIYDANSLNIPLHKTKNEVKGSAGYGGCLGLNADVSYTPTNSIVLKAGGNYNHQNFVRTSFMGDEYNLNLKNNYKEGAVGYYKFLKNHFINSVELSAGYGNCLTKKTYEYSFSDRQVYEGNYQKYFLQCNLGHVTNKAEFGIAARYSRIFFPTLKDNLYVPSLKNLSTTKNIRIPAVEIAVMAAIGKENLKATLQYGLAVPQKQTNLTYTNGSFGVESMSMIFQLGIRYRFLLAKPEKI